MFKLLVNITRALGEFMIRTPRNILISHFGSVKKKKPNHHMHMSKPQPLYPSSAALIKTISTTSSRMIVCVAMGPLAPRDYPVLSHQSPLRKTLRRAAVGGNCVSDSLEPAG